MQFDLCSVGMLEFQLTIDRPTCTYNYVTVEAFELSLLKNCQYLFEVYQCSKYRIF